MNRPYYWYRPSQLAVRLRAGGPANHAEDGALRLLRTAWGSHLHCWPDPLGNSIARTGTYDLIVAETLARLADPGETAVDAGANVGVMSNLLAHAVGPDGRVISFEPHPLVFRTLSANVARWRAVERIDTVEARQAALSLQTGILPLTVEPHEFVSNKGTASLERGDGGSVTNAPGGTNVPRNGTNAPGAITNPPRASTAGFTASNPNGDTSDSPRAIDVRTVRLADEVDGPVGVMKLDVERHELAALRGAEPLLARGMIRDVLFEEHRPPPTPVTALLEEHGYTVLGLRQGIIGPLLSTPAQAHAEQLWDPPALLATRDPDRARRRLRRRGWVSLTARLRGVAAVRASAA